MTPTAVLLMTTLASAAELPDPPALLAQLTVATEEGDPVEVQLRSTRTWTDRVLDEDLSAHRDPVSTRLQPAVVPGEGTVHWLVGYRLSQHHAPGDTLVTCSLLLQTTGTPGMVRALWYEDHQQVPTSLYVGGGRVDGSGPGAAQVDLAVKDVEYGDVRTLRGRIRGL